LDDISFDDAPPLEEKGVPSSQAARLAPPGSTTAEPAASSPAAATEAPADGTVPGPVANSSSGIAYITVADASGRVLFRRAATAEEVDEALRAADEAEREGQAAMDRISSERFFDEALEAKPQ
jgi:hypothetical protein